MPHPRQRECRQDGLSKARLRGLDQLQDLIWTVNLLRAHLQSVNIDLVILSDLVATPSHALRKGHWIEANSSQGNLFVKDR
jgi:hypothetical protein